MLKQVRNGERKLEELTGLEFTEMLTQWKQEMFRAGTKDINELEIIVLENSLEPETSEKNIKINKLINDQLIILKR